MAAVFTPLLLHPHLQTMLPSYLRRVKLPLPEVERLELSDGDFLDLDWYRENKGSTLAILAHGLEGSSRRPYVQGMVRALLPLGIDSLAWNFRSCSGTPNRLPRLYCNNDTADLHAVVEHAITAGYQRLVLIGFSMGANVSLLCAGRLGHNLPKEVTAVAALSAPVDLADSAAQMAGVANRLYMRHFLHCLHNRIRTKRQRFSELLDDDNYHLLKDFKGFDDRYTAPLHGFADAEEYWTQCSAAPLLHSITVPTLILNALDDPFLGPACYPQSGGYIQVETPRFGGHLGFMWRFPGGVYYSEERVVAFIKEVVGG